MEMLFTTIFMKSTIWNSMWLCHPYKSYYMTSMNINPLILIMWPCSKNISEGQFNRPQWYIIFRSLFILRLIPLRNFEISSNFSSIMIRQDAGGSDDGVLPLCDCGSGINGAWSSGGCYGDPFYLGIYGGLGITIGLLSFTKSLTMLKGIIRNGCSSDNYSLKTIGSIATVTRLPLIWNIE